MSVPDEVITREFPPPPPAPEQNGATDHAVSILSGLRKEHREVRAARTQVFVIPGYEDRPTPLACRYGVIPFEKERELERRLEDVPLDDPYRELNFWVDQLINSCREFGVMVDGEFQPLDPDRPVQWGSPRLLQGLGIVLDATTPTARDSLKAVFRAEHGDEDYLYAISRHHTAVILEWMGGGPKGNGAEAQANKDFAKNS